MGIRLSSFACAVVLFACGGKDPAGTPDASEPDGPTARCGDLNVQQGEDCDDGTQVLDAICDATCHFTCGNGVLDATVGELCETSIALGAGSCPTTCVDADACTSEVLSGSECSAECIVSPITTPADGDGCCPSGANANNDNDCTAMCGNGILETGEGCDTGIALGAGACPATCNDGQSCTTDTLTGAGSCQAACTNTAITLPINNDGCCPPGANAANDNNCSASCGNGVREGTETCDTAIAAGLTNACPTTCDDNVACTTNVLSNGGTCTAACSFPAITMPINGDGCCPPGANANNDNNCTPVCGNGAVEGTEQCDDGNLVTTDACSNTCTTNVVVTAFRFNTLKLRDPHAYATIFFGCSDITDSAFGNSVNEQFATNMTTDGDMNGFLDLSPVTVFRPLNQGGTLTSPTEIHFADCTAPVAGTMCKPGADPPILLTATNQTTGTCLGPIAGTTGYTAPGTGTYSPAITPSTAPCFGTTMSTVVVNLAGVAITLRDARIAATYSGGPPATNLVNGLLRGFITEADANSTIFPAGTAVVGGKSLAFILPGGTGNCANHSAKDMNNGMPGWWFYLNFTAPRATWSDL